MKQTRVVIADEFPLVCDALETALTEDPAFSVVGRAASAAAALELSRQRHPDVLVLGLVGPEELAVVKALSNELPSIRTVVVTADDNPWSLIHAIESGATGYLTKRATLAEIRRAVHAVSDGQAVLDPVMAGHLTGRFRSRKDGKIAVDGPESLDARELLAVKLVASGLTDRQIADQLSLSVRGVQAVLARARSKSGVSRRAGLARWAVEHALV